MENGTVMSDESTVLISDLAVGKRYEYLIIR